MHFFKVTLPANPLLKFRQTSLSQTKKGKPERVSLPTGIVDGASRTQKVPQITVQALWQVIPKTTKNRVRGVDIIPGGGVSFLVIFWGGLFWSFLVCLFGLFVWCFLGLNWITYNVGRATINIV